MDPDAEFTYTQGMTDADVETALTETPHGVLALADEGDAYAIPVYHHYEDGSLYVRLGETADSDKKAYIETTETATYVVYDADPTADPEGQTGWSVLARGPITEVAEDDPMYETVEINERYDPIRVFDEDTAELELRLYELRIEELTGRRS